MRTELKNINVYVDKEELQQVREKAAKRGLSMSAYLFGLSKKDKI